jgi:hypothetical protein
MALTKKVVADRFEFSGNYYFEILNDLKRYKRSDIPESTAEDDEDIFVQFLKGLAWNIHLDRCLIDVVANERFVKSASLAASVNAHLQSIGQELSTASPATVDQIIRVTLRSSVEPVTLLRALREFSTEPTEEEDTSAVSFENVDAFVMEQRNDRVGHVFGYDSSLATFSDVTASAQSGAAEFQPLSTFEADDSLYIGHKSLMFDRIDLVLGTSGLGDNRFVDTVWEYFTDYKGGSGNPTLVETSVQNSAVAAGAIRFDLTQLLGTNNRKKTKVRVLCALTGASEDIDTQFVGGAPATSPSIVYTPSPPSLKMYLNNLLGTSSKAGTSVMVTFRNKDQQSYTVQWDGTNNYIQTSGSDPLFGQTAPPSTVSADYWVNVGPNYVETTPSIGGFLGQTEVSLQTGHYVIYPQWKELPSDLSDPTKGLREGASDTKKITYTLPQDEALRWERATVNAINGYYVRLRLISKTAGGSAPYLKQVKITEGGMYGIFPIVQGRTFDEIILSSDGLPGQSEALKNFPVIKSSIRVFVTEAVGVEREYSQQPHLFNSAPEDRHFVVELSEFGQATVGFGNGVTGKIPTAGIDNVRANYRQIDDIDGNVAAGKITAGIALAGIDKTWNPRAASGWSEREGFSLESVAAAKAKFHTKLFSPDDRYLQPGDVIDAVLRYTSASGSKVASRAFARELGQKLVEVVALAPGGGAMTQEVIDELEELFNGNEAKKVFGRYVSNQEVRITPATLVGINLTATVYSLSSEAEILARIMAALQPEAINDISDEEEAFLWAFGEGVPASKLIEIIMSTEIKGRKASLVGTGVGTISGTISTNTITGSGTTFLSQLNKGDRIYRGGEFYTISSIASNTLLTTASPLPSTFASQPFTFELVEVPLAITELPKPGTIALTVLEP